MKLIALVLTAVGLGLLSLPVARVGGPWLEEVAVGAGVFGVVRDDAVGEAAVELRWGRYPLPHLPRKLRIQPTAGALVNGDRARYAYAGFRLPFEVGSRWTVTPYSGVGAYGRGDGKDLGGTVEFRSGLEVAIALTACSRLGLTFYHLSNATLYDGNPGTESLALVYSHRLRR